MIPLLQPSYSDAEIAAVTEVLKSGWWGQGPKCEEFERRIAELHGYKYAVTTNSATAALHLALLALGIGPGDEVIVPALTFISTALAVTYTGAKPIFVDVRPDTLTLDWNETGNYIADKGYKKVKVIIPVDYAGYPAAHKLVECNAQEPYYVQDAAHSCGGYMYGDLVCFSFHPVKNLATGDGGCILTNSEGQYNRLKALRWCGIDRSTYDRVQTKYGWDYNINEIGYKYHWNDIQAAIGLAQLNRLPELLAKRRSLADYYAYCLEGKEGIQLPASHEHHTWHLFPIRVDADKRDKIIDYLLANGISAGVHYKPLTYYPMYSNQPTPSVTEREWKRLISLPIFHDMMNMQVSYVCEKLLKALDNV